SGHLGGRPGNGPCGGSGCPGGALAGDRATARQWTGEPKRHGMKTSYACRAVDAVDAAALLLGRSNRQPELLLQRSREDAAHGVALPSRGIRHLIDRSALGSTQHRNDLVLL